MFESRLDLNLIPRLLAIMTAPFHVCWVYSLGMKLVTSHELEPVSFTGG